MFVSSNLTMATKEVINMIEITLMTCVYLIEITLMICAYLIVGILIVYLSKRLAYKRFKSVSYDSQKDGFNVIFWPVFLI